MGDKDLDLTTDVGAGPDVARLGREGPEPAHEQTADEDIDVVDWDRVAATPDFASLLRVRARFLIPATVFFMVYYFTLLVAVGFFPELMSKTIPGLGPMNLAYLFALSQFAMVGVVTFAYLRAAKRFDVLATKIRNEALSNAKGPKP
ncbi:MAG: DUF485 domain-containing protein [Pseudomonadota bacterium]